MILGINPKMKQSVNREKRQISLAPIKSITAAQELVVGYSLVI